MRYQVLNDLFWGSETMAARQHYGEAMRSRGWLSDLEEYRKRKKTRLLLTQMQELKDIRAKKEKAASRAEEASEGRGPRNEGPFQELEHKACRPGCGLYGHNAACYVGPHAVHEVP